MEPPGSAVRRRRVKKTTPLRVNHRLTFHDGTVDDEDFGPVQPKGRVTFTEYLKALCWWTDEYRCAVVCILGSVLLGLLLHRYDDQLVPNLPFGLNLDMVIVAMMTAVRVALKGIVESSISQGAWIWVSEARQRRSKEKARLEDFKLFDEASRGL
jgi:hypothetical protein